MLNRLVSLACAFHAALQDARIDAGEHLTRIACDPDVDQSGPPWRLERAPERAGQGAWLVD
jgi:hypothetical protein